MSAQVGDVRIVMVEDDAGHARLIERSMRRAGIGHAILHAPDGRTALDAILGASEATARDPFVVLLDLNLPDMPGIDILRRLKADPRTRYRPVLVLSTTDDEGEIRRCYDLGANAYITKPIEHECFANAIRQIGLFVSVMQVP